MTTLWAFVLAIAVLVVVHELGHYWIARWCGVKVLRFSIGFGKPLFATHIGKGETEWVISAVPVGGYVKMLDEREGEVAEHELHRAFNRQPVVRRMAIVVAGPISNLLLAVVLYWSLFMHGVPGLKPILGEITPQTPAAAAQFREQETILSINGEPVPSWQDLRWILLDLAFKGAEVRIEGRTAQGEIIQHVLDLKVLAPNDLDGDFLQKLGLQLFQPLVQPIIDKLTEGGVAQRTGLRSGDHIRRIDGRTITRWAELVEAVRSHPGSTLHLEIERSGNLLALDITPDAAKENGKQVGRIGAGPYIDKPAFDALLTEVRYAPPAALEQAVRRSWETAAMSLKVMGKMVIGEISLKNLSGPITIADYAGQSAKLGAASYLDFLALISISLGVLNLLPIPLLDGGHLLYYMVELIKGSPVSEKAWEAGQNVGIALLVTLMAFALYNDISRLILG
ncbi:MAG: RIP metalloprotease RseP [Betaproteobacteria bacterium]|nr:RIP metalloprotease RseP [Betaproteobacteria bacterium]MDE2309589.1 RIP metalloprotease RseP [Betaproteobacteria bacterium]